ncbi:unnamed protein product, partial [Fusarium langsethiae]
MGVSTWLRTVSSSANGVEYNVPNDEQENERLDLQHALFLRTFDDNLGFAPTNDADADVKHVQRPKQLNVINGQLNQLNGGLY